jgi:hypothetical protein
VVFVKITDSAPELTRSTTVEDDSFRAVLRRNQPIGLVEPAPAREDASARPQVDLAATYARVLQDARVLEDVVREMNRGALDVISGRPFLATKPTAVPRVSSAQPFD